MTYRQKRIKVAKRKIQLLNDWLPKGHVIAAARIYQNLTWWEETLERLTTGESS